MRYCNIWLFIHTNEYICLPFQDQHTIKLRKRLNNEQPEPIYFSLDFSVVIASFYFRSTLKEKKMNSLKFKHQVARGKHFSKNLIIMSHAILVLVCTIMQ